MIQTLKNNILPIAVATLLALSASLMILTPVSAQDPPAAGVDDRTDVTRKMQNSARCGSNIGGLSGNNTVNNCTNMDDASGGIEDLIKTIINVFSAIVGSISVIMIIIGGFRYITSGGDSNSVGGAKNTILYAIVGLIIVAFAQIIVQFVLQRTTG